MLAELEGAPNYAQDHLADLPAILGEYKSILANLPLTLETVERSNLKVVRAEDVKAEVKAYLQALGGITVDDDFFYHRP